MSSKDSKALAVTVIVGKRDEKKEGLVAWLTGKVLLKKTFQTAREARKALDGKNFSKRFLKAFEKKK